MPNLCTRPVHITYLANLAKKEILTLNTEVLYRIFSLQPKIFNSFFQTSLIARGLEKGILSQEIINWREEFGIGNYKQIDDRPLGGGSGMVLMPEPIFKTLEKHKAISSLFKESQKPTIFNQILPNNSVFYQKWKQNPDSIKKVTISLTPRGYTINQNIFQWLATNFSEINLLCGRYEGFDARISSIVDLELSLGNFILNGGEVPAMALIEGVSRLLPNFITKSENVQHESFSPQPNFYPENYEFVIGKNKLKKNNSSLEKDRMEAEFLNPILNSNFYNQSNLFDETWWKKEILPNLESPQFTKPNSWKNLFAPEILLSGNHKLISSWRKNWFTLL